MEVSEHEAGMEGNSVVSGRIHQQEFRQFWVDRLEADSWTLEVLQEGYSPPWQRKPGPYQEANNASVRGEEVFVWETVKTWQRQGAVEAVAVHPTCVSPLSVAKAVKADGRIKKRLCLDGSRHINLLLEREPFRMTTVAGAAEIIEPGDFQFCYDLDSAYFHVLIAEKDRDFLGFQAAQSGGLVCPKGVVEGCVEERH